MSSLSPPSSQPASQTATFALRLHGYLDEQFTSVFLEFLERSRVCLDELFRERLRAKVLTIMAVQAAPYLVSWQTSGTMPAELPHGLKVQMIAHITDAILRPHEWLQAMV